MPTTTNPLPQLIAPRLVTTRGRVQNQIWETVTPLPTVIGPLNDTLLPLKAAKKQTFKPIAPGSTFGPGHGAWKQRWFQVQVPAPKAGEDGRRYLRWDVQGETTVYLDGHPWAGLDVAHRHCPLPDRACTLWLDCGLWLTGIWVPGAKPIDGFGPRFDGCFLAVRNEEAWGAYWDLECLVQALGWQFKHNEFPIGQVDGWGLYKLTHERVSPLIRKMLRAIDGAIDAYDMLGLTALRGALKQIYQTYTNAAWAPTTTVVGMAHIDLVWLWPENVTEHKGVHTFATQLRLMERYPEYIFNQSQPALTRAIERLEPMLAQEVETRIHEGRWEMTGGFEVECDNQLPSGEALARSLAIGQRKFKSMRGDYSDLCWLPDVFGYSAALPQILRLGGVTRFYTTKMTWSAITRFPYNSFTWKGHDGSEVLTHLCSTGYNQNVEADQLITTIAEHRQADVHDEMLVCVGFGDGGGGTTEDQLERARRFRDLAGVPKVQWSTGEAFFDRMEKVQHKLPVYQGELYLEYHRGTFTTQGEYKRLYRRAESALQVHEAVRVATGGKPLDEAAWRRVSFAQFHDAIPGSSIALVYQQLNPELEAIGDAAFSGAATELAKTGKNPGFLVFNPLPVPRTVVIELPLSAKGLHTPDGTSVPVQKSGKQSLLAAVEVPALGATRLLPSDTQTPASAIREASATVLDNGTVQAHFDANGQLVRLTVEGRDLRLEGPAGFMLYEDKPAMFDAWDIDHSARGMATPAATRMNLKVVENGPARAVLRGTSTLGASPLTIEYILEAGARHLQVVATVDWLERHLLLKYHVRTGYRGRWARYGTPFGSIQRPQLPGVQADEAMWEVPAARWAAVTDEDGTGLAIVTEAKFGFSCREGDLGLTLLRSPCFPDRGDGGGESANFTDRGVHHMRFAIGEHRAISELHAPSTAVAADTLFTPCVVVTGGALARSPFHLEDLGTLAPSWVLPASESDGFIIRLHETNGSAGAAVLHLAERKTVSRVDFLERKFPGVLEKIDAHTVRVPYKPYEVICLLVR
jgi:alpha-mannosidase